MCSKIKSSFNGKIKEIPGIAVDNFETANLKSRAFFLSHCHSDHTKGLFTDDLLATIKCNKIIIYMSELSAAIVADDCKNNQALMRSIKPLRLGTTHITLPELFGLNETYLRVSLIPAGHCLGSVMFLFETNNKVVLYTGDFNISSNDISSYSALHNKNHDPLNIDVLYVDTTFIGYNYQCFPKRSDVIEEFIEVIREWLNANDTNRVALNTSAKYGYEFIYNEISKKLGLKVYVNNERWSFYREQKSMNEYLTHGITNVEKETKIHVCRDFNENGTHKLCCIATTPKLRFLFVRFSAMKWDGYEIEGKTLNRVSEKRLDVCFPTHCSRSKIISFVDYFSPKKVVGFPNPYIGQNLVKNMLSIAPKSVIPKKRKLDSPNKIVTKVIDRKMDQHELKKIFD